MKMLTYVFHAFLASLPLCVVLCAQDSIPGVPDPTIVWASGTWGIVGGRMKIVNARGRVSHSAGGVHITGEATADSEGTITYNNVTSGTTTSEYFEAGEDNPEQWCRVWERGAIIGASEDHHHIAVLKGSGKFYISRGGAEIKGSMTADGKGGYLYTKISNVTTPSEYTDGEKWWEAGAVLEITEEGKIRVIRGSLKSN